MSDDVVNIFVDNLPVKARKGQMIMQATDPAGIYIPRFCYHEKLSVAANCRMCLVEVEKAPKPLPACATPVTEGMKVFTKSPRAISAQKATMEFLLINHPLDCPICDQGGECELQDLAIGFGRDISRYAERKRVVKDKNLGPLVSTDMTRCIHCTRCVRFGQEVQGFPQLGTTGRGEHMEITTYVEQSVDHELSANIVDLCPVGALNNKPFRYRGRSWEMTQHPLVSPHDAVGTNLYAHSLRGKLMRIVPRQNDEINETWIADRDRFGFEGIYADDRVTQPMLRVGGELRVVDWETALAAAADGLAKARSQHGGKSLGFLAVPAATAEEFFLLAMIARGLGSDNIDHRLRQADFRAQDRDDAFPSLGGLSLDAVDRLQGILVIGSNLRQEVPLLAHRVRKAAVKAGAKVAFVNPEKFEYLFPVAAHVTAGTDLLAQLQSLVKAVAEGASKDVPAFATGADVGDSQRGAAAALLSGERRAIFLGHLAQRHPDYQQIKALARTLGHLSGASVGIVTEGPNSAGAFLAGAVPHRRAGGDPIASPGLDARAMLSANLAACVLFGGIEPEADFGAAEAAAKLGSVIAVTSHLTPSVAAVAQVVLPIGTFAETSGTYVNIEGRWQSWPGAIKPLGESRPGWKVLRVLGNLLGLSGFDFNSSEEVRNALQAACKPATEGQRAPVVSGTETRGTINGGAAASSGVGGWVSVPMYQTDLLVRRSPALAKAGGIHAASGVP